MKNKKMVVSDPGLTINHCLAFQALSPSLYICFAKQVEVFEVVTWICQRGHMDLLQMLHLIVNLIHVFLALWKAKPLDQDFEVC